MCAVYCIYLLKSKNVNWIVAKADSGIFLRWICYCPWQWNGQNYFDNIYPVIALPAVSILLRWDNTSADQTFDVWSTKIQYNNSVILQKHFCISAWYYNLIFVLNASIHRADCDIVCLIGWAYVMNVLDWLFLNVSLVAIFHESDFQVDCLHMAQ